MKIPVKLQELIPQPEAAILSISSLMGQKLALVDCTNIAELTPEQLNLIFTHIPPTWDYQELTEIFNPETCTETFTNQLIAYIDHRLGRTPRPSLITNYELRITNYLDIFNFRNEIIGDYRRYIESFLKIRDHKVREFVNQELEKGQLWTNPLVQLNPKYRPGATVTELVNSGILHPECTQYFSKNGKPFHFHYHQQQAFETAEKTVSSLVRTYSIM
jgi:predicted DNA-binding protein (UPF0278 family)